MKDTKEEIRLIDDKDLVEYRTDLEGWTGADNLYHGKGDKGEERARYANHTHKKCNTCSTTYPKANYCPTCAREREKTRTSQLEVVDWDGKSMMASEDNFFSDMDDVLCHCEDNEIDIKDLDLRHCEMQVNISTVNIDELNEEYCTNDGELGVSHYHPEIAAKVKELNELINNAEPKLWFQTNKRIKV
jgi:hypothetical protein